MQFLQRRTYEDHAPAFSGNDDWGRIDDGRRRDGILVRAAAGDGGGSEAGAVAGEIGFGDRADGAAAGRDAARAVARRSGRAREGWLELSGVTGGADAGGRAQCAAAAAGGV